MDLEVITRSSSQQWTCLSKFKTTDMCAAFERLTSNITIVLDIWL